MTAFDELRFANLEDRLADLTALGQRALSAIRIAQRTEARRQKSIDDLLDILNGRGRPAATKAAPVPRGTVHRDGEGPWEFAVEDADGLRRVFRAGTEDKCHAMRMQVLEEHPDWFFSCDNGRNGCQCTPVRRTKSACSCDGDCRCH